MREKVLVTGASGLLGRHVVQRLARERVAIRALVRSEAGAVIAEAAGTTEVMLSDLRETDTAERATAGVSTVYHCAGHVRRRGSWEDFEEVNVWCTERLLRASEAANVETFVHVSSVGIFPMPGRDEVVTEESPTDPIAYRRGAYTYSKTLADTMVSNWMPARPMRIAVVRPGHIFGVERPMFGRLARPLTGRRYLVIANPDSLLGFTWVENCADALVRVAHGAKAGISRYIVVDDESLTQQRFLEAVQRQAPGRYRFTLVPVRLFAPLLQSLPLPRAGRDRVYRLLRACCSIRFSTERLRRDLGWQPPVLLDEAVGRMLAGSNGRASHHAAAPRGSERKAS